MSMKSKPSRAGGALRARDPFLDRESGKYAHPVPSREFILDMMAKQGVPLSFESLVKIMEIVPSELEEDEEFMARTKYPRDLKKKDE